MKRRKTNRKAPDSAVNIDKKVLIMAGGTGGHIFPGLAVADQLKSEGWTICWLGTPKRMEARLVPEHGYDIQFIDVSGVRGNGLKRLLLAPFMIIRSIIQAIKVIRRVKPTVVLGFGGFASGPGGIAAWLLGKPVVLHEQNAIAGFTNRTLAYFATQVLMAFPKTFARRHKAQLVGNPIRQSISQLNSLNKSDEDYQPTKPLLPGVNKLNVLILGGSLGAEALNRHIPRVLAQTTSVDLIKVWHQTGRGKHREVEAVYQGAMVNNRDIRIDEFIVDMSEAYKWADIAICRSGALTVAEVAAAGVAAIFVPFPHAVDDHQTLNAGWLADNDAAIIVPQVELEQGKHIQLISDLLENKSKLQQMAEKAGQMAITDATDKVAAVCKGLAGLTNE
ncbi:MAG: UDP-N-acetylglucosamine--N-acetylmuramyl-(pentapeptide) pyrophosphoryl-undecaprenol N-acetylglucosamine transferase [Alteromonadaceae bacterium]|jgi:UDP-N-acetylglucosamine--N-acetylmuramyl-(pentapeptide) pyrophosphoryl-undecaprenol N-acetylglucosamine transferase